MVLSHIKKSRSHDALLSFQPPALSDSPPPAGGLKSQPPSRRHVLNLSLDVEAGGRSTQRWGVVPLLVHVTSLPRHLFRHELPLPALRCELRQLQGSRWPMRLNPGSSLQRTPVAPVCSETNKTHLCAEPHFCCSIALESWRASSDPMAVQSSRTAAPCGLMIFIWPFRV